MKIGVIRETKNPPDRRVPLTPAQCADLHKAYPQLQIIIEPSPNRCYSDQEYRNAGLTLSEDLSDCNILLGVKEVDIPMLKENKSYLFFSHTAKEQPYNRPLLQEIIKRQITLIDYEYLTRPDKSRVVAFGRWAGIVGAYNGLLAYGRRMGSYHLTPAWQLNDLDALIKELEKVRLNNERIVLTGGGRVAGGALEILVAAGIRMVSPEDYVNSAFSEAVFCRLDPWHYTRRIDSGEFDFSHFVENPGEYENAFVPYSRRSDIFIACHFWDPDSPLMLTKEDLKSESCPIKVVADISCDIDGPIASTIRPSTIADPLFGYDPVNGKETRDPFDKDSITVMAVDNLPGELPRNASEDFGNALISNVIPSLMGEDSEGIIQRATIVKDGELTELFSYLKGFAEG